ncbi:AAA family ATPase [Pseudonocardia sp. NPDC046786]|uniref:AAA family ATPase n=1 Tax=Pseudonocardia sp. NPDC046786 TaxID=3155471 RepID=UPI0033D55E59
MTFDYMSFDDAIREAEEVETWLVQGLISAGTTLIYGQAKVGKSFLVSALIAALTDGTPYLGADVPEDREFSVALCWADDGDRATYARQVAEVLPDGVRPDIGFYTMPAMNPDKWEELYAEVMERGHSLLIIDNLTQVIDGSINSDADVGRFFQGVRRFTRSGIPVVIIGHSSEKVGANGHASDKPMGSSAIRAGVRWLCFVKRAKSGNLTLAFSGNHAEPHTLVVKHGPGARFEVVKAMDSDAVKADAENRAQQRGAKTYDENRRIAEYVVEHCQEQGVNAAARTLETAPEFPSLAYESARQKLKSGGPVRALLNFDETGKSWTLMH